MRKHWPMQLIIIMAAMLVGWLLSHAATVNLAWDPVAGATMYRIYASADQGQTWAQVTEVGTPAAQIIAPDTGLILYRASALNAQGEAIRFEFGAWYNGSWQLTLRPAGLGIQ